ncbi:MAG: S9 family peptidase [Bacteroidetes bacterium]|nr:S9 family peptidase [Bacteroidota bacterium]
MNALLKAENPLAKYTAASTRLFNIKGEDNTLLWCRMLLPANFDSTKKYPVIVYVYGGPHAQMITNSWMAGSDMWFHYLTQEGYIVFTLDNRGSGWRGKAFEQATFRNLGEKEMADQLSGVNYLRKMSFVDGNRLGVNGWSYGGFMTTSLMTRNPGIFKVGVAGGPVIDWSFYEIMYTERYMDTPESNPAGYKLNNLLNYVDQLNGRLMLIHGTSDDVVVWQHSLAYLKKSVSSGVQVDYMVYPGHLHNVLGKDRIHLYEKITRYFNDFLK